MVRIAKSSLIAVFVLCSLTGQVGCAVEEHQVDFELSLDPEPINREDPKYLTSYAPILKPAKEAVVAVYSASVVRFIRQRGLNPREEMLRRFFGMPPSAGGEPEEIERRYSEGVGSGVVISQEGYILTNNHVITARDGEPADEIFVELSDGRELAATLVGRDPQSDLAVLQVDADDLQYLTIADSDLLEVGDIVFAIGNPMGIGLTITQGIVSATGRSNLQILGESGYESFIQTDAPINPGNSGGALVDAYGRLIGINTAIVSRSGGSVGLGFAIPSTFARDIALDLVRKGEVRRGLLGISMEDLNPEYAEAFGVPEEKGAFIQAIAEGLPAEKAGIQPGDVVVAANGKPIEGYRDLRLEVGVAAPDETITLSIRREGKLIEIDVTLADPSDPYGNGAVTDEILSGIEASVLDDKARRRYGIDERLDGLVVTGVSSDSPYATGFAEGALILEINGQQPRSFDHAKTLLESRAISRVLVYAQGRTAYLSVRAE
ncbi:MAG: trypsin-like peptidase domain-containing protein [Verrucomicrobiota bacterium]